MFDLYTYITNTNCIHIHSIKDGCKFSANNVILGRVLSVANMKMLLETGKTSKIEGFISKKTGKPFSAVLKLDGDKVTFDF